MFQRPKLGETEDDLLKQQEDFFRATGKQPTPKRKFLESEENVPKHFEIMGDIVEKRPGVFRTDLKKKWSQHEGFPMPFKVDVTLKPKGKKSLFAMQLEKNKKSVEEEMEIEETNIPEPSMGFDETQQIVNSETDESQEAVHKENLEKLSKMTQEEILQEQKKLLETLDPNLVNFLKNRKKDIKSQVTVKEKKTDDSIEVDEEEIRKNLEKCVDSKWINIDFMEKEKLQWIGDIPDKKSLEADQPYSARFDFKGDLQPFVTDIDVRNSLYHHGEESNRPGYTIQELYQLSRSQVLQQRILALNTLANLIRKTKLGYYDKCFDGQLLHKLVESDLFFLLRFSIDDNPVVPASVNCLHNLICNESDEFCLDKLLGVTYRDEQPLIFNKIETNKEEENELKDHTVISCDMIKGVLRTDLIIRLSYILNNFTQTRETVIRAINCLIKISRHSLEAAIKVFDTKNLIDFVFNNIKTNAPIYEGVKLFRILITQSQELAIKLTKNFDLRFLVSFIEAEENTNILKKEFYLLKLEIFYFWRALLFYDLFLNEFVIWSPCLVRLLLFYTQKVGVSGENDFDYELFSAMTSLIIVCNKKKIQPDVNIIVMMRICLEKWLSQLIQFKKYNYAVSKALGCAFRYFTSYFRAFGINALDMDFIKKINSILVSLFQSEVFGNMSDALQKYSYLLSFTNVVRDPDNLPSLCSVYDGGDEFLRIVQNFSPFPFFISVTKYLKTAYRISRDSKLTVQLFVEYEKICKYVHKICHLRLQGHNWFMRFETDFLTNFLELLEIMNHSESLLVSFRLLPLLRVDDKNSQKVLKAIFVKNKWNVGFEENLRLLYSELLLENRDRTGVLKYRNELVPEVWMYKAISLLRGKEDVNSVTKILKFISLILKNKPDLLNGVSHTFRYYHLCSVFLTDSNVFDAEIQNILEETFNDVAVNRDKVNLNVKIENKKSFYDLYTELITQYAGVSYGLPIFAKFVLFPLQNRFNISFRKLIWFEYLHVLRVITVPVESFVVLKDFIDPPETDESLLVAYINSVSNNVILKTRNPFIYYIAVGNIKNFLNGKDQDEKLLTFLKRKVNDLKNAEFKNDILSFSVNP